MLKPKQAVGLERHSNERLGARQAIPRTASRPLRERHVEKWQYEGPEVIRKTGFIARLHEGGNKLWIGLDRHGKSGCEEDRWQESLEASAGIEPAFTALQAAA